MVGPPKQGFLPQLRFPAKAACRLSISVKQPWSNIGPEPTLTLMCNANQARMFPLFLCRKLPCKKNEPGQVRLSQRYDLGGPSIFKTRVDQAVTFLFLEDDVNPSSLFVVKSVELVTGRLHLFDSHLDGKGTSIKRVDVVDAGSVE